MKKRKEEGRGEGRKEGEHKDKKERKIMTRLSEYLGELSY